MDTLVYWIWEVRGVFTVYFARSGYMEDTKHEDRYHPVHTCRDVQSTVLYLQSRTSQAKKYGESDIGPRHKKTYLQ